MSGVFLPVATLWWRECVRFSRDRTRALSSIATALLFWVLIGFGLAGSFAPAGMPGEVGAVEYLYPGTVLFVVLLAAIVGTFSLIEDRRAGFLQGVIVAPVPRASMRTASMATVVARRYRRNFIQHSPLWCVHVRVGPC